MDLNEWYSLVYYYQGKHSKSLIHLHLMRMLKVLMDSPPFMRLELSDGNVVKNTIGYEEGTYELKENKLVLCLKMKMKS